MSRQPTKMGSLAFPTHRLSPCGCVQRPSLRDCCVVQQGHRACHARHVADTRAVIRTTRRCCVQVEPELMKRACRAVETALEEATETENGSE